MVMKNNAYWKQRMELLEEAQLRKGERYLKDLEEQYRIAARNIENDISRWYQRFADNNQITMSEARKLLSTKELEEFKWDVFDYIKFGEDNALNQQWMKQLENASARVHVSRLDSLKIQLQQQIEVLYGNQTDGIDRLLRNVYSEGYYHTAWEIQKGFNIGWNLQGLNNDQLDKILSRPWTTDARTFSDRLWTNKQQLVGTLQNELTQAVMRGQDPSSAIKSIAKQFNVDRNKAGRLVMTEAAAMSSASQKDAFNALDVERFEIVATLDSHTSEICQDLDGEIVDMKDFEVGVTAPPFHPWCRTTTVPYFEDNFGERAARDAEGNVYYVPSDMKYKDWKKTFVDGGDKGSLAVLEPDLVLESFKTSYNQWDGNNVKSFATSVVNSENLPLKVQRHKISAHGQCRMYFNKPELEVVSFEINSGDIRDVDYQIKTVFHELFHAKSHNVAHDIGRGVNNVTFKEWAYIDDVFAESTSHYITKNIGISREIAPSYAGHLIDTLPKLKKLPDFKDCKTIADFGEVAYKYRFSNTLNASWKPLLNELSKIDIDMIEYSKDYTDYIVKNKDDLVDKLLENMPKYKQYKSNMVQDIDTAVRAINNGYKPSGNEKMIFENALIIAMNRLGVN